jgi:hypothetical protein
MILQKIYFEDQCSAIKVSASTLNLNPYKKLILINVF